MMKGLFTRFISFQGNEELKAVLFSSFHFDEAFYEVIYKNLKFTNLKN